MTDLAERTAPPALAVAVRWTSAAHFVSLVTQAGLALGILSGFSPAFAWHRLNGHVLLALGGVQALAALANGPRRTGPLLTLAAVGLAPVEAIQVWLGQTARTEIHALTGFAVWALGIAFTVKVWDPSWVERPRAP